MTTPDIEIMFTQDIKYQGTLISNELSIKILPSVTTMPSTLPVASEVMRKRDKLEKILKKDLWCYPYGNVNAHPHLVEWYTYQFNDRNYILTRNGDPGEISEGNWELVPVQGEMILLRLTNGKKGLLPESYIDYDEFADKIILWGDNYSRPKLLTHGYVNPNGSRFVPLFTKPATQPANQP